MVFVGEERYLCSFNYSVSGHPEQEPLKQHPRRPFTAALDVVASSVHFKLKYHNLHGEPTILHANLEAAKKMYHALERDQGKGPTMEIDVTFLIWLSKRLKDLDS